MPDRTGDDIRALADEYRQITGETSFSGIEHPGQRCYFVDGVVHGVQAGYEHQLALTEAARRGEHRRDGSGQPIEWRPAGGGR
jgi:hypothetical protein